MCRAARVAAGGSARRAGARRAGAHPDQLGGGRAGGGAANGRATAWVRATRSASAIPFGAFAHLLPGELRVVGPVNLLRLAGDVVTGAAVDGPLVLGVDDAHL